VPNDSEQDGTVDRDSEQDERLKKLEEGVKEPTKFSSIVKVVSGIGAIIGVVATVVGYGVKLGEMKSTIEQQGRDIAKLQAQHDAASEECRGRVEKLADTARERFRQDEAAVGELRGSLLALLTEVRVRHEESTFTKLLPVMAPGAGKRPPPQAVQEDMAAEASDVAIDKAIKAAPPPMPAF